MEQMFYVLVLFCAKGKVKTHKKPSFYTFFPLNSKLFLGKCMFYDPYRYRGSKAIELVNELLQPTEKMTIFNKPTTRKNNSNMNN